MPLRALTAVAVVAAVALALALAGGAPAQDSEAPPGATPRWLPCERWVMEHWLPFDEARLHRLLRVRPETVRRWLRDDQRHNLAQLVRRRGHDVSEFAARLVAPRRDDVSAARLRVLERRAERVLTQGHLSQHILFHPLHQPAIALDARRIFGVRAVEYRRLRLTGWSPARIAEANGRTPREIVREVQRVLRRSALRGIRGDHVSRAQAWRFFRFQRGVLPHWVATAISKPGARRTGRVYRRGSVRSRRRLACFLFAGRLDDRPRGGGGGDAGEHAH